MFCVNFCIYTCPIQTSKLNEELQSVSCERDQLLSRKTEGAQDEEALESLRAAVAAVTEERNRLQEVLQGLREEHGQLRAELEESNDVATVRFNYQHDCSVLTALTKDVLWVYDGFLLLQQLRERLAALTEENDQLNTDARENVEMVKP